MKYARPLTCLAAICTAVPALADLEVTFTESAPKDQFTFTNTAACDLGAATLTLDLSRSAAGLIFDTTGAGAGVEVFQPFQTVSGSDVMASVTAVKDGDTVLSMDLTGLGTGQSVAFTIDVDDTLADGALGQIRVAGSEISGATVTLASAGQTRTAAFASTSRARVPAPACTS